MNSRRPSASMIVSMIALVLALGGTAIAADITKKKVKSIAAKQVENLAPTLAVKSADTSKIATNIVSANVNADGTMAVSIPSGATSSKTALGTYTVNLGRPVTGCTLSASPASTAGGPPLGFAGVGVEAGAIRVFTRDSANAVADRPFFVQAICPG